MISETVYISCHQDITHGFEMKTKSFCILHSNDMHGDFLTDETGDGKHVGGLALLSAYINKVRKEEENVLYVIAGDIVQGGLIDSEYKGISSMAILNYIAPDVVALGNHEFDYGLPHLLFLEKVANFPIVNANLYIKPYNKRLMKPFIVLNKGGSDILVTGVITEKVMDSLRGDNLISSFVTLEEASQEVGKISNAYKTDSIDLTIILTHIGLESDIEFARMLKPEWGVDLIVGGHSHSYMERPELENGVIIVHAGMGTDQVGRLDLIIDTDTNTVLDYKWRLVTIDENLVDPDPDLEKFIRSFQDQVDNKYNSMIGRLAFEHTHPSRTIETSLGNLFADALAEMAECDVMFLASGSIRSKSLGPLVTLKSMRTCFPYNDYLTRFTVTGATLKRAFGHIMRKENRRDEGECYQINGKVKATYSEAENRLIELLYDGNAVEDDRKYTICLQAYHYRNSKAYLDVSMEELEMYKTKVVSTSTQEILEEWLRNNQNAGRKVEGRLVYQ
jgi:5'-nucleotidase/UDP-sugar diphosphatase